MTLKLCVFEGMYVFLNNYEREKSVFQRWDVFLTKYGQEICDISVKNWRKSPS